MTVTTLAAGTTTYTSETTVAVGDTLRFPPNSSATLVMDNKNLIVYGTLEMKPSGPNVVHLLQFINVNEANFVGAPIGGTSMTPVATDIGLWVMDTGVADLQGSPKVGWNRTGTDPSWAASDEMLRPPWISGNYTTFATHTLGASPETLVDPWGTTHTNEVFNLTRNVRIEGTAGHKAHALIMTPNVAQTIKYVQFRHLGPRNPLKVRGRWSGVHFHHMGDGGYDSLAEGCVVRDGGAHAYVSHATHGTTFRDCVSYNTSEDAYWWDSEVPGDLSDDVVYDHCLAAKLVMGSPSAGKRLSGFWLGDTAFSAEHDTGDDDEQFTVTGFCNDCVTVGNQGALGVGIHWQEGHHAVWEFADCVAHNNANMGIYIWQNRGTPDLFENFTAFNNRVGILNGAYSQRYQHHSTTLFNSDEADFEWRAVNPNPDFFVGQVGEIRNARVENLTHGEHVRDATDRLPSLIENSIIGHVIVDETVPAGTVESRDNGTNVDYVNCTQDGSTALELADFTVTHMHEDSTYRVQRIDGTAYQVHPDGTSSVIAAFAGLTGTGAFAAATAALAGAGAVAISHGNLAAVKPTLAGTGSHQISISGPGAFAAVKPALAGIGTSGSATTGHIEGAAASFAGTGYAAPEEIGSGFGSPPFRVRSLRTASRARGVFTALLRGEGGPPRTAAIRLRALAGGSLLRGEQFPARVRAGGVSESSTSATVTPGAVTFTGQTVLLRQSQSLNPGAVTFTGQTVALAGPVSVPVTTAGAITFTGQTVLLRQSQSLTAGAVTFTGQTVNLVRRIPVEAGDFYLTGQTINISGGATVSVSTPGAVTLTGQTVQMTGLTAIGVTPGTITFSGAARAITVTELVETASTAQATSYASGSYTPTANRGLLAWVAAYATLDPAPTFTGNGLTWTLEAIRTLGAPAHSICLFSALSGSSPSTGAGTFDCAADAATGAIIHVVEIDGCDLVDFTTQVAVNGGTAGVTPSGTFAGSTDANAAVLAYLANTTNPAGVTEPSGFTELMDTGFDTPASGGEMSYRTSPGAITTVTWGSNSASIWATHIVEVKAGQPIALRQTQALTPAAVTFTGQTVNVGAIVTVPVTAGALTLAGQAIAVRQVLSLTSGALVFAGQSVNAMEEGFNIADEWRLGGLSGKWHVGAAEGKWLVGAAGRKWHVEP